MKKVIFFIIFLCFYNELVNAQYIYFNKRIDVADNTWDISESFIMIGNEYLLAGVSGPYLNAYLSKYDSKGNKEWFRTYDIPGISYYMGYYKALFKTKDNNVAFCGTRVGAWPAPGWGFLIKVDSLFNKTWEREYQIYEDLGIYSGATTNDGGYILTGDAYPGNDDFIYFLLKTDSLGEKQWYKTFTGYSNRNYAGYNVLQTPDNGYCIGGGGGAWYISTNEFRGVAEIIKTDSLGNLQWRKTYGNPSYANSGTMICLSNDSCIIGTYRWAFSATEYDYRQIYITKIGMNGAPKWHKRIGPVARDIGPSSIESLEDGGIILSGGLRVEDTIFKYIGFLFKLNHNGDSLWYREYEILHGENQQNFLNQVLSTPDNGFAGMGYLYPNVLGTGEDQDSWLFKTDSLGCLVPNCTGIGITEFNPQNGADMIVFPNPFNNVFAINYNIPKENKRAVFMLYDVFGKLVYKTTLNNYTNQLQVIANSLTSGVYIASLIVDGKIVKTEKIIKGEK